VLSGDFTRAAHPLTGFAICTARIVTGVKYYRGKIHVGFVESVAHGLIKKEFNTRR
jgi:hypothetical protein